MELVHARVFGELAIGRQLGMAYTMAYTIISDACAGDGDDSAHRSTSGTYEIMDDSLSTLSDSSARDEFKAVYG